MLIGDSDIDQKLRIPADWKEMAYCKSCSTALGRKINKTSKGDFAMSSRMGSDYPDAMTFLELFESVIQIIMEI